MKVLIIEDEQLAAKKLVRLLKETNVEIEIAGEVGAVESAVNWLNSHIRPDLIFMDIQLGDGLCFDIFEKCKIKTPVIFTTAYDEYTLRAFKVNSVDYLLKPIKPDELRNAIHKFYELQKNTDFAGFEKVLQQLQPRQKERFLIKVGEQYKSIEISAIDCFYINERFNFIHVNNGKNYAIDYSLDKIEEMVDLKMFFRINRNMIVNFSSIQDIRSYSSSRLKITLKNWTDKDELLVSRERVIDFKLWMDR
jgi:two-component system, LytTR family, response regulator LytT